MEELEHILELHARRYPLMEPVDAVKLIYQNEFGGGHLIRDEAAAMEYLRREYVATPEDPRIPLYEPIGNGICRVNLAALDPAELDRLGRDFIHSAAVHKGSLASFREKLEVLCRVAERGAFSFDAGALRDYLAEYTQAGCPMVSHSPAYRNAYHPAYRIIKK